MDIVLNNKITLKMFYAMLLLRPCVNMNRLYIVYTRQNLFK